MNSGWGTYGVTKSDTALCKFGTFVVPLIRGMADNTVNWD